MLRVLYILWDGHCGAAWNLADFIHHVSLDDYQITAVLLSRSGPAIDYLKNNGIKISEMHAKSGMDFKAFVNFTKFLIKNKFDLIHNNNRTYFCHLALILGARKTPCLFQEHGDIQTEEEAFSSRLGYKLFSKIYSKFMTVSDDTKSLMEQVGVPAHNIENIANPIDLKRFEPTMTKSEAKKLLGLNQNDLIVGTACRFVRVKDLPLFLKTCKCINEVMPGVQFVLAGGGIEETQLRKLTDDLGLRDVVHFVGIQTNMPIWFRAFDVFLLTSHQESFGRTIVECLATGTPIVAVVPALGGGKEIVKTAQGILCTYERSSDRLSELTISLLADDEKRKAMGLSGCKWILNKKEFHVDQWAQRLTNVYHQVLMADTKLKDEVKDLER